MGFREKFDDQEWEKIKSSLLYVFSAVAGADGNVDKKEKKAFQNAINRYDKIKYPFAQEVIKSIGNQFENLEEYLIPNNQIEDGLKSIADLLKEKVDATEALIFKKNMIALGLHIGNSSGGIFGAIFGDKLSDEELDALKRVGQYLGVSVAQLQQSPSIRDLVEQLK